ncbi:hypothetical protein BU15DRAFT_84454 [Melanogaster broomeanus]|nr:hypothetical protein BU15DRAFT_84454 [Melanogaster broomeanus]
MGIHVLAPFSKDGCNIGFVELARCLASWPALKALNVSYYRFLPTMVEPTALRLPVCALTKLELRTVSLSDRELMHIMSSSLKTLERVVFDSVYGITNACLRTSLDAISHNVTSLSILRTPFDRDVEEQEERPLDATINKMLRLRALEIDWDVATELMLQRRAKLFCDTRGDRSLTVDSALPVIQLSLDQVPGIFEAVAEQEWPGWEISSHPFL